MTLLNINLSPFWVVACIFEVSPILKRFSRKLNGGIDGAVEGRVVPVEVVATFIKPVNLVLDGYVARWAQIY